MGTRHISIEEADAYQSNGMHIEEIPEKCVPKGDSGLDVDVLRASLLLRELGPSERINRAKLNGEKWALAATKENIAKLPERQLIAFLWFYWGGRKTRDIADEMKITRQRVKDLLEEARKNLAHYQTTTT